MYVFCFFLLNDIMLIDNLHEYVGVIRNKIRENSILTGGFRQKHAENTKKG